MNKPFCLLMVALLLAGGTQAGFAVPAAQTPARMPDVLLLGFFSRAENSFSPAFKAQVAGQKIDELRGIFELLASGETDETADLVLRGGHGVALNGPQLTDARLKARTITVVRQFDEGQGPGFGDGGSSVPASKLALAEKTREVAAIETAAAGGPDAFFHGNRRGSGAPASYGGLMGGSYSGSDGPSPSAMVIAGGGKMDAGHGFFKVGAMGRLPVVPLKTNKYGNIGVELGLLYSHAGGKNQRIGKQLLDYKRDGVVGDWEIMGEDFERRSGTHILEILGAGYQTPWLGLVNFEGGGRLGWGWDDTTTRVERVRTMREFKRSEPCRDANGNPTGSTCEVWETRDLDTQTLSSGGGDKWNGLVKTAYAAMNVHLPFIVEGLALRVEGSKVFAESARASGWSMAGGLNYYFGGVH